MFIARLFVVAVICYQNVFGTKHLCSYDDSKCLTESTRRTFRESVTGKIQGAPHSDPLYIDLIEADLPTLKYMTRNITFKGMKSCKPELAQINPDLTYIYHLACRHLSLEGQYESNGKLASADIKEQGKFNIDSYDYLFKFTGELEKFTQDNKKHITVKSRTLDTETRGKVVYDFKNLADEKSTMQKYINENIEEADKAFQRPLMDKFTSIFFDNINAYTKVVPAEELFYIEN